MSTDPGACGERARRLEELSALRAEADCERILERMHSFLDHELDDASSEEIRAHLDACEDCMDDYDVVEAVKELVNRCCQAPKAPQQLRVAIVTSITRWRAR